MKTVVKLIVVSLLLVVKLVLQLVLTTKRNVWNLKAIY